MPKSAIISISAKRKYPILLKMLLINAIIYANQEREGFFTMKSGVATFTNLPGYIAWMESMGLRGWKAIYSIINKTRYGQEWSKSFPDIEKLIVPAFAEQYTVRSWSSYPPTETEEAKWPGVLASTRKIGRAHV